MKRISLLLLFFPLCLFSFLLFLQVIFLVNLLFVRPELNRPQGVHPLTVVHLVKGVGKGSGGIVCCQEMGSHFVADKLEVHV